MIKGSIDILKHPLIKQAYELCREIEGFAASDLQTAISLKASELTMAISQFFENQPLSQIIKNQTDVCQLIDGWRTTSSEAWTHWDEETRKAAHDVLAWLYQERLRTRFSEFRKDGWPLCPKCGEDELVSAVMAGWPGNEPKPTLHDCLRDEFSCANCHWHG